MFRPILSKTLSAALCSALFCLAPIAARPAETDQYLTWELELNDSAPALNAYLNAQIERFLERARERPYRDCECEELASRLYVYLFQGLHASKVRNWLHHSDAVDRFPPNDVSYWGHRRMSIYRGWSFPYFLPMARTIRLGDVYLGTDKIGHFFGFGRRYFERYLDYRAEGFDKEAAMEKVVRWGIIHENGFVGKLVDGIFSHADLEADFQGFMLARDLCEGESPYFQRRNGAWVLDRPIDILDYVTPDFDESYNNSHYWALRKRNVLPLLRERYGPKIASPIVAARFARYAEYTPSFSKRIIDRHFKQNGEDPQARHSLQALIAAAPASP